MNNFIPTNTRKKRTPSRAGGFTLVEMLVVVVIIAILVGITFKLINLVGESQKKAVTIARMNRIKQAIEAFKIEFGQYPPVNPEHTEDNKIRYGFPDEWTVNQGGAVPAVLPWSGGVDDFFQFGLMSYLLPRWKLDGFYYNNGVRTPRSMPVYDLSQVYGNNNNVFLINNQWKENNLQGGGGAVVGSLPRDVQAVQKWLPYIEDLLYPNPKEDEQYPLQPAPGKARNLGLVLTRRGHFRQEITILDGWDQEFYYHSEPPYTSYRLWSTKGGQGRLYGNIGEF